MTEEKFGNKEFKWLWKNSNWYLQREEGLRERKMNVLGRDTEKHDDE